MTRLILTIPFVLTACNLAGSGESDNPYAIQVIRLAADRTCPLTVPERDTLMASALINEDRATIQAFLDARPEDPLAQSVLAVLDGEPVVDPDQMACIAPYM